MAKRINVLGKTAPAMATQPGPDTRCSGVSPLPVRDDMAPSKGQTMFVPSQMLNKYRYPAVCLEIAQNNEFPQLCSFRRSALKARRRYRATALDMAKRPPKLTARRRSTAPVFTTRQRAPPIAGPFEMQNLRVPRCRSRPCECARRCRCRGQRSSRPRCARSSRPW
jgi:hypothetical protein